MFDIQTEAYLRSRAHNHPLIRPIPESDPDSFPVLPVAIAVGMMAWTGALIAIL